MLKKLKIKFITIIMTIVTIMFSIIFGMVFHLTKHNIERDSIQMMQALELRPIQSMPISLPDDIPDKIRLPFFTVVIKSDGELEAFGSDYYDLTDKELLNNLVESVSEQNEQIGIIGEYNLRYLKSYDSDLQSIVFADISSEKAMLNGLIRNSIIIGAIGYVIFFFISLFLAKWVTKPVQKTWDEQKQFIADASHELKTPLTVIMTNAEMLEDVSYNEYDRKNFTKNILSMSKRMKGLVEDLLELARMDNGTEFTTAEKLDYSKLITNSVLPFEPLFYEKDIEIIINIENGIYIKGDKTKIEQVVNILLDNAMKYSNSEYPVKIDLKSHEAHCILTVSGKGISLSKSDCKNIFKRFYRIDKSRTDSQSYGLGLAIADSIVREHNGKIWAESKNGYNTFYVSLERF